MAFTLNLEMLRTTQCSGETAVSHYISEPSHPPLEKTMALQANSLHESCACGTKYKYLFNSPSSHK